MRQSLCPHIHFLSTLIVSHLGLQNRQVAATHGTQPRERLTINYSLLLFPPQRGTKEEYVGVSFQEVRAKQVEIFFSDGHLQFSLVFFRQLSRRETSFSLVRKLRFPFFVVPKLVRLVNTFAAISEYKFHRGIFHRIS